MKRNYFISILAAILFLSCDIKTNTSVIKETNPQVLNYVINNNLSLKKYSKVKGYFPQEGLIPTAEIAFQIIEPILNQLYGKELIQSEKPFSINLENDIWIIEGYLEKGMKGGVAYVEIRRSNGEILKVIHTE